MKKLKLSQTVLLEQYLENKLTKGDYQIHKEQITTAIQEAAAQLSVIDNLNNNTTEFIESHKPFFDQASLTREMAKGLIKEVRVTSADAIEIVWNFQELYKVF